MNEYMLREAKFGILFRHWIKANPMASSVFELKDTLGSTSLPYSCVAQAQIDYALAIEEGGGVLLRNRGGSGEPDYTYHHKQPAYIVIKYPDFFCLIRIKDFIKEKDGSKRKSLTADRAKQIAEIIIN